MEVKEFDSWNEKKKVLHICDTFPFFREKEIWYCSIGLNVGWEEDGKHDHFERPVLVLRKFTANLFLALPLTSKFKVGSFFIQFMSGNKLYTGIYSQIRVLDGRRLRRKVATVQKDVFIEVHQALLKLLAL